MHRNSAKNHENRFENALERVVARFFCGLTPILSPFYLSVCLVDDSADNSFEGLGSGENEQNESRSRRRTPQGRQDDRAASAKRRPPSRLINLSRGQVAAGFGFLVLRDLAPTAFREVAGLMLRGLPVATGVAAGSGSFLKNLRQSGLSCALFLIMQTVTRSTSGMSELQSRNASPLQACCCSGV